MIDSPPSSCTPSPVVDKRAVALSDTASITTTTASSNCARIPLVVPATTPSPPARHDFEHEVAKLMKTQVDSQVLMYHDLANLQGLIAQLQTEMRTMDRRARRQHRLITQSAAAMQQLKESVLQQQQQQQQQEQELQEQSLGDDHHGAKAVGQHVVDQVLGKVQAHHDALLRLLDEYEDADADDNGWCQQQQQRQQQRQRLASQNSSSSSSSSSSSRSRTDGGAEPLDPRNFARAIACPELDDDGDDDEGGSTCHEHVSHPPTKRKLAGSDKTDQHDKRRR